MGLKVPNYTRRRVTHVFLVHGTNSSVADWPTDSELARALRTTVEAVYRWDWSGANSHAERLAAAERLSNDVRRLLECDRDARVGIVGHSHGGTVAVYAAHRLTSQSHRISVVTLGSPILELSLFPKPEFLQAWRKALFGFLRPLQLFAFVQLIAWVCAFLTAHLPLDSLIDWICCPLCGLGLFLLLWLLLLSIIETFVFDLGKLNYCAADTPLSSNVFMAPSDPSFKQLPVSVDENPPTDKRRVYAPSLVSKVVRNIVAFVEGRWDRAQRDRTEIKSGRAEFLSIYCPFDEAIIYLRCNRLIARLLQAPLGPLNATLRIVVLAMPGAILMLLGELVVSKWIGPANEWPGFQTFLLGAKLPLYLGFLIPPIAAVVCALAWLIGQLWIFRAYGFGPGHHCSLLLHVLSVNVSLEDGLVEAVPLRWVWPVYSKRKLIHGRYYESPPVVARILEHLGISTTDERLNGERFSSQPN